MKRWLPAPWVSLALAGMWLLLNESLAPGHVLLALLLGWLVPLLATPLRPPAGPLRRPAVLARLLLHVAFDVVASSLFVSRGVLGARHDPPRAYFVTIPLELRDPFALAALAMITTVVPGTVWSELARDRSALRLHVFDVEAEDVFVRRFKQRYERPLKEIFE